MEDIMTIVEALKELRLIEKRMQSNRESITRYASMVSTERPYFEDEKAQRKEVDKLLQANKDLFKRYLELKMRIERTNFTTTVEIGGEPYTITELLTIKRRLARAMIDTYNALNDSVGTQRLRNAPTIEGQTPQVVRLYDERAKNEALGKWQTLYDNIDSRLEVINATTPLVE